MTTNNDKPMSLVDLAGTRGEWVVQLGIYSIVIHVETNRIIYCPCGMDAASTRELIGRAYCNTEENQPYSSEHMKHWDDVLKK